MNEKIWVIFIIITSIFFITLFSMCNIGFKVQFVSNVYIYNNFLYSECCTWVNHKIDSIQALNTCNVVIANIYLCICLHIIQYPLFSIHFVLLWPHFWNLKISDRNISFDCVSILFLCAKIVKCKFGRIFCQYFCNFVLTVHNYHLSFSHCPLDSWFWHDYISVHKFYINNSASRLQDHIIYDKPLYFVLTRFQLKKFYILVNDRKSLIEY